MKIYIASSEEHVGNIQEDAYIRDGFTSIGVASEILTLKNIVHISTPSDVVILKSIWGYHENFRLFVAQISALEQKGVRLINDYPFIAWNLDKGKYLTELKSMDVVPTCPLDIKNSQFASEIESTLFEVAKALGANKLVIKPTVSASGYLTDTYETNKNNNVLISSLVANKSLDFIAQPYRSSIIEGETSVILISGTPLYGVVRFPGVLATKGATTYLHLKDVPVSIKETVAELKHFFLKKFGTYPSICRVDFLKDHSDYEILEVELIDPDLFFRHIPDAIRKDAISMFCNLIK